MTVLIARFLTSGLRVKLRESLKCRDFRWFIDNKVPSLASPSIIGSGEIRNYHHQFCLDQQDGDNNVGLPVLVFDCTGLKGNQYWYYSSGESLRGGTNHCSPHKEGGMGGMQIQNVLGYDTRVISSDLIKLWQCTAVFSVNEENRRLMTYLGRPLVSPESHCHVCIVHHLRRDTGP